MLRTFSSLKLTGLCSVRCLGAALVRAKHTLPDLPYDFGALEPYISADILKVHHGKHHATYVNNLNAAEEKLAEAKAKGDTVAEVAAASMLRFNAGGHVNHSIFWQNLAPKSSAGEPSGELKQAIERGFGSLENMQNQLTAASVGVQGSGWGWLGYNRQTGHLQLATTFNQDMLEPTLGLVPLFTIDVWEHAYYLQYKNMRPDFVKAIWNIANWKDISERFANAKKA
jgi:Fe-Mn family superoxide dismutase